MDSGDLIMTSNLRFGISAALVALAAALAPASATAGTFQDVYTAGHADISIHFENNALGLNYHFGSNAVINGSTLGVAGAGERDADTITVFLNPANSLGTGAAGLPAPFAGNPLYTLPQSSRAGRPFLGIGADEIDLGVFQNNTLLLTLTGFAQAPAGGQFILWQLGSEATPLMNSADGFSAADVVSVEATGHDHYTFGFTQLGTYDLTFTASGTLMNGTQLTTSGVYRFQVGAPQTQPVPEPGSITLAGIGVAALGLLAARRRKLRTAPATAM
jgi:surface-anchored protein